MKSIFLTLLGSTLAAEPLAETSPDANFASDSANEEWFWKGGGFGGGYTTVGAGGGIGTTVGGGIGGGGVSTVFFTSLFTETLTGPVATQFLTIPGFTTTVFLTAPAAQQTDVTSFTTIPITTTITQS